MVSRGDKPKHVYTSLEAATKHVVDQLEKTIAKVDCEGKLVHKDGAEILALFKALIESGWIPLDKNVEAYKGKDVGGLNFAGDEWYKYLRLTERFNAYKVWRRGSIQSKWPEGLDEVEICTIHGVEYTDC